MQFIDLARITVRSGSGGNGSASFRREKYVEFGGPDGGDGGRGGHVFVEPIEGLNTLVDFRYRRHVFAGNGGHGRGKQQHGANGPNAIIKVPCGTEVLSEDCQTLLFDLTEPNQRVLLARGGNGGFGNTRFKSSTNRAPRTANEGQPGIERIVWLRLKVLADVGLVGLPNVGKSTFLSSASNAKPKIGNYPFTTLYPNLGTVSMFDEEFIVADVPGLVEDAHLGRGLGDRFLGHVERCKVLLHLVDATSTDPVHDYQVVCESLEKYGSEMLTKPRLVAMSKIDAVEPQLLAERHHNLKLVSSDAVLCVSAIAGTGMEVCLRNLLETVCEQRRRERRILAREHVSWTP